MKRPAEAALPQPWIPPFRILSLPAWHGQGAAVTNSHNPEEKPR